MLRSRHRFFCRFGCVAAGGGADCRGLCSRYRVFCDFVCVAAGGGAKWRVLCSRYRVFRDFGCVAAGGRAVCGVLCSRYRFFCCFGCVAAGDVADCGAGRVADAGWRCRGKCRLAQSGCLSVSLSGGQSDFESQDVVVHVEAVSDVEVALAEDTEAEMVVEADRRIVAVHVQFYPGFASTCSLPHMSDRTVK